MEKKIKIRVFNCVRVFLLAQLIYSCHAQKVCSNCGIVEFRQRYFDTTKGAFILAANDRDRKMWYKDSMVIQEVFHIYQSEDDNHNINWNIKVERYKFIDLRTKDIFEYYTFSDTAKVIKKCTLLDTNCIGECWKFWSDYDFMLLGQVTKATDTIIGEKRFLRYKRQLSINTEKGNVEENLYAYFDCDRKSGLFKLNVPFSKKVGCPLIRIDVINTPRTYFDTRSELFYHPDKLNPAELKVFEAWEKNARAYKDK